MPIFDAADVPYYNPQVDDWSSDLLEIEGKAKETAEILLFVIDSETRALASITEAAEFIGRGRHVVLTIKTFDEGATIGGEELDQGQLQDLNRMRNYLGDVAKRNDVHVAATIQDACHHVCEYYARLKASRPSAASVADMIADPSQAWMARPRSQMTIEHYAAQQRRSLTADAEKLEAMLQRDKGLLGLPRNGVSLRFLRQFAEEFGIEKTQASSEACVHHTKRLTQSLQSSLVLLLQEGLDDRGVPWVGRPSHYLLYPKSLSFRVLIDMVANFERDDSQKGSSEQAYYFLDYFSLNHHQLGTAGTSTGTSTMNPALVQACEAQQVKAGHTVVCLHPWNAPVALSRCWCLFELWLALNRQCAVSMCFSSTDSHALLAQVSRRQFHFQRFVEGLDVAKSQADSPSDKERILGLITKAVGVAEFNKQLQSQVFRAVREAVITRFQAMQTNRRSTAANVQHTLSFKSI